MLRACCECCDCASAGADIDQAKVTDRESEKHTVPGMIRDKSDWSKNSECKVEDQIQSEYWTVVYYSLLISITSFLVTSLWKDREGAFKKGAEVTVEPEVNSECGSVDVVEGSYFAVADFGSTGVGIDVMYTVITTNGERHEVRREYFRHRKWHRIAFLQVTNDKKHDCWSSQAFAYKRLNFFDIFDKEGFDAAREFARNDRAE